MKYFHNKTMFWATSIVFILTICVLCEEYGPKVCESSEVHAVYGDKDLFGWRISDTDSGLIVTQNPIVGGMAIHDCKFLKFFK